MCFWTVEEFLKFDQCFLEDELVFRLFFRLAFFSRMRKGERLALYWKDIHFKNRIISVDRTVTKINGTEYFNDTQTKAWKRRISINQKLVNILSEWKSIQQTFLQSYLKDRSIEEVRVFEINPYQALDAGNIRKKYASLLKGIPGLIPIRIQDFRHSHSAMCYAEPS